ncbi:MAG: hypothetical protein SF069_04705 [Phycisphaerae bacterium]|nr:hypothetical protein [Phycisphaerae bacterium]
MRCFVHEDRESIGICVACGRGVCRECVSEEAGAVSCRNRCEGSASREVLTRDLAIQLTEDNQRADQTKRTQYAVIGVVLLIAAASIAMASGGAPGGVMCAMVVAMTGGIAVLASAANKPDRTFRACPKCSYNLTGTTTAGCPECGWKLSELVER